MDPNWSILRYVVIGMFGVLILYASMAHPPLDRSQSLEDTANEGDTGVHINSDGTIDYYKSDTDILFSNSYIIFTFTTIIGIYLVGESGKNLWRINSE